MSTNGDSYTRHGRDNEDTSAHKACYVFAQETVNRTAERPTKRRKILKTAVEGGILDKSRPFTFPLLLEREEDLACAQLRHQTFQKLWAQQGSKIEEILKSVNAQTLSKIAGFVTGASLKEYDDRIPTGLIVAGPSIASHGLLFEQIGSHMRTEADIIYVTLIAAESSNLKTVLKKLIRSATNQHTDEDEDDRTHGSQGARTLLNYDLQILRDHVLAQGTRKMVIAFQDSEAFDSNLLADLIIILRSWLDRIPFVLLFGIATSVDIFHDKLPRPAIRCMRGSKFDVERAEESFEHVFSKTTSNPQSTIHFGPVICRLLLERQKDHVQSIQAFTSALKYAYMSLFYANPLSIFLVEELRFNQLQRVHFEAVRNLPSFRKFVKHELDQGNTDVVRSLLEDDENLYVTVIENLARCRDATLRMLEAVDVFATARSHHPAKTTVSQSELYLKAVRGELRGSSLVRDLLLSVKKLPSDALLDLLNTLTSKHYSPSQVRNQLLEIKGSLTTLIESSKSQDAPLRSEYDVRHETLRTTVVAQKVELSKQKSTLSQHDSAYSELVHEVHDIFETCFSTCLIDPHDLFLHEIIYYDLKSPHRDVFMPKPRYAIERALSAPHDYLGCNCCGASSEGLSATQPPTAILYQLYLESGALINVFDLWSAFCAVVGSEDSEDDDENKTMALFFRALAELKFMGLIKYSKKKIDHLAKLAWKGL